MFSGVPKREGRRLAAKMPNKTSRAKSFRNINFQAAHPQKAA